MTYVKQISVMIAQIKPVKSADSTPRETPILARDVRFLYESDSSGLDKKSKEKRADGVSPFSQTGSPSFYLKINIVPML